MIDNSSNSEISRPVSQGTSTTLAPQRSAYGTASDSYINNHKLIDGGCTEYFIINGSYSTTTKGWSQSVVGPFNCLIDANDWARSSIQPTSTWRKVFTPKRGIKREIQNKDGTITVVRTLDKYGMRRVEVKSREKYEYEDVPTDLTQS